MKFSCMKLNFGLKFSDLYCRNGLIKLDQKFRQFLLLKEAQTSDLIGTARFIEDFLVELFGIKNENEALKKNHDELQKIYVARRDFVQRNVAKKIKEISADFDGLQILQNLAINYEDVDELEKILAAKILAEENLADLEKYAAWALYSQAGRKLHKKGSLFILPQKVESHNLLNRNCEKFERKGFDLTDKGSSLNRALAEAHYCIFCHKQDKDSCRKGLFEKGCDSPKIDALGVELHGCPLDEKISEMNLLKSAGFSIAAFSVAVLDNPMIAGTGHRICNDCMKSCIYQKQDPVDIPQIETRILKDVLGLPYGFEIYSLLTRWNPLNKDAVLMKEPSGKRVLVCGLGPAGYTLSHYLLNDGHDVVAIDGLKIEPLNSEISGVDCFGNNCQFKPIKFVDEIYEPLSSRIPYGFGGVAEYGITVRWDKNFLKIIRLLLERRKNFQMFGGIRFGSSITDKIAFERYGFDHVSLCIGAGRPNIIKLKNNFAKGVRMASDFLMSLQLTGSFKEELFTNLQIRMPAIVVGGGLTAVDSACEIQAYYLVQVKKFAKKVAILGKEKIWANLNIEEKAIADEFLRDAENPQNIPPVKILYRRKIQDSPAYRLNHQELQKAFEEGIEFIENVLPTEVLVDEFNHIKSLKCADDSVFLCRSLIVAAGTSPNISPKLEDGLDFEINDKYFAEIDLDHKHYPITHSARPKHFSVITKIDDYSKKAVSFLGDLHPNFEGNVVKAMKSAKIGRQEISKILQLQDSTNYLSEKDFWRKINSEFLVKIFRVERLSDYVFEIFIHAPLLANQSEIGQIFRLQNYHAFADKIKDQLMAMEGVTVTALSVDKDLGIISGIVVNTGGSTALIAGFKAGEPCIFMGPCGKPTEIPKNETVVFVGGGRGNQPLTALAEAFTQNGCKVLFFAGYRKRSYIIRKERMKKSCAELMISIEDEVAMDVEFQGSVIDSLKGYFAKKSLKIDRVFTIGNDKLMSAVAKLRHEKIIPEFAEAKHVVASLNSPMQCMLKGVCSQCLQKRINDEGESEFFYSCADQDQNVDKLDFLHLQTRCEQNSLAEKVSKFWIADLLS